jgi:hypothetical protein
MNLIVRERELFNELIAPLKNHKYLAAYMRFERENPHVYPAFEKALMRRVAEGRRMLSFREAMQEIRWSNNIVTSGDHFKISDPHIAYFGRYFLAKHPELTSRFVLKGGR